MQVRSDFRSTVLWQPDVVTDRDGKKAWAYLGSKKIGEYMTKHGIRVTSGDYLKRF